MTRSLLLSLDYIVHSFTSSVSLRFLSLLPGKQSHGLRQELG